MTSTFVSLGMVVLDELRFPNAPTMYDVVGGSGAYSTVGSLVYLVCGPRFLSQQKSSNPLSMMQALMLV